MNRRRFFASIVSAFVAVAADLGQPPPPPVFVFVDELTEIFNAEAQRLLGRHIKNVHRSQHGFLLVGNPQTFPDDLGVTARTL